MQPDTKVNGEAEALLGINESKIKYSNIQLWDHRSFAAVYNTLVSNKLKVKKNGHFRGSEYVELTKKQVIDSSKMAALMVREFREKAKKEIEEWIKLQSKAMDEEMILLKSCRFTQVIRKLNIRRRIANYDQKIDVAKKMIIKLDQTPIK